MHTQFCAFLLIIIEVKTMSQDISKRYTVAKFADKHPEFATQGSLRFIIFNADNNGLNDFNGKHPVKAVYS